MGTLAGVAGFEPTNTRVKVWCLTAWRHPYIGLFWKAILLYHAKPVVSSAFQWKRYAFGKNIALPSIILPIFVKAYSLKCKKSGFQKRFFPALALRARQALRAFGLEHCNTHAKPKKNVHLLAHVARTKRGGATAPPFF